MPPRYRKAEIKRLYGKGEVMVVQRFVVVLLMLMLMMVVWVGCGKDEPDNGTLRPNANLVNVRF